MHSGVPFLQLCASLLEVMFAWMHFFFPFNSFWGGLATRSMCRKRGCCTLRDRYRLVCFLAVISNTGIYTDSPKLLPSFDDICVYPALCWHKETLHLLSCGWMKHQRLICTGLYYILVWHHLSINLLLDTRSDIFKLKVILLRCWRIVL